MYAPHRGAVVARGLNIVPQRGAGWPELLPPPTAAALSPGVLSKRSVSAGCDIRLLPRIITHLLFSRRGRLLCRDNKMRGRHYHRRSRRQPRLQHMKKPPKLAWLVLSVHTLLPPAQSRRRHTIGAIFIAIFRGTDLAFNVQLQRAVWS